VSSSSVNGLAPSLKFSSLLNSKRLCVRLCEITDGAIINQDLKVGYVRFKVLSWLEW
jgi:hypothetical protein